MVFVGNKSCFEVTAKQLVLEFKTKIYMVKYLIYRVVEQNGCIIAFR